MASIKIVRRKNKEKKDGSAPIAIRISKNYKTNYTFTGQYILEKDWDEVNSRVKKTHPNSKRINNFLLKKFTEVNDLSFETNGKISSKELKQKVVGKNNPKSFFQVGAERIEDKYQNSIFSVANSELSILFNIEEFISLKKSLPKEQVINEINERRKLRISKTKKQEITFRDSIQYFKRKKDLSFVDIDETFLKKYKSFCSVYLNQKTRTITNQLIFIRTLFNIALVQKIIDRDIYPFGGEKEKIKVKRNTQIIGLTKDEIERIESMDLEPYSFIWHTRNIWLFTFYLAGIRISDALKLKWGDFIDERLYYVMNKNEKPQNLKIPDKAKTILEYYKKRKKLNQGYVFPFLATSNKNDERDIFRKSRNASKLFNDYLKEIAKLCDIDKNLSNHIARHSFGNIAGDKIHPLMLQKLYRHSDLKTTLNYQANFIHKDVDEALDNVINF